MCQRCGSNVAAMWQGLSNVYSVCIRSVLRDEPGIESRHVSQADNYGGRYLGMARGWLVSIWKPSKQYVSRMALPSLKEVFR